MLKNLCFVLMLALSAVSAGAQNANKLPEAVATPIPYVRAVPASILAGAHKPFNSLFFGIVHLKGQTERAIHLYSQPDKDAARDINHRFIVQPFHLDVWERAKGRKQWRLLNSADVSYESHEHYAPIKFGASFLWLDEKKKSAPMLRLNCYGDGMYGDYGDWVYVVFPNGWRKAAAVQAFGYGTDQSSDYDFKGARFERGGDGVFQVRVSYGTSQSSHEEVLRWNGLKFAAAQ